MSVIDMNARLTERAKPGSQSVPPRVVLEVPAKAEPQQTLVGPDIPNMTDEELIAFTGQVEAEKAAVAQMLGDLVNAGKRELERRILERREKNPAARAIPHAKYEVELEEQFSSYTFDLTLLEKVGAQLPDDERAKIIKHVAERVEIIPAHVEAGNVGSIKSLRDKYAGTEVGDLLAQSISRVKTGEKLIFKPREMPKKAVR